MVLPTFGGVGYRDRADTSVLCSEFRKAIATPLGGVRVIRRIRGVGAIGPYVLVCPYIRLRCAWRWNRSSEIDPIESMDPQGRIYLNRFPPAVSHFAIVRRLGVMV